jgi:ankyrin repeat protein
MQMNPQQEIEEFSVVFTACQDDEIAWATALLDAGDDVDVADSYNWTPITYALCFGQPAVVRLLHERGVDLSLVAIGEWNLLHFAAGGNREYVE